MSIACNCRGFSRIVPSNTYSVSIEFISYILLRYVLISSEELWSNSLLTTGYRVPGPLAYLRLCLTCIFAPFNILIDKSTAALALTDVSYLDTKILRLFDYIFR